MKSLKRQFELWTEKDPKGMDQRDIVFRKTSLEKRNSIAGYSYVCYKTKNLFWIISAILKLNNE